MADFEIYTWDRENALAPVLFLEETKTPYHMIPTNPESRLVKKELTKISPLGEVPVLVDRRKDKKNVSIFGTSAILCYLALDMHKLISPLPKLYGETLQWIFWQEKVIHGTIIMYQQASDDKAGGALQNKCRSILKKAFKRIDARLKRASYLAEEFSIADASLFFLVRKPETYGIWINEYMNLRNWMTRISNRTAIKKTLEIKFY